MGRKKNNDPNYYNRYSSLIALLRLGVDLKAFEYLIAIWLYARKGKQNFKNSRNK